METAISIAHTCRLLNASMAVLRVREEDLRSGRGPPEAAAAAGDTAAAAAGAGGPRRLGLLDRFVGLLGLSDGPPPAAAAPGIAQAYSSGDAVARSLAVLRAAASSGRLRAGGGGGGIAAGVGLVIDGAALALALTPAHEAAFLELCRACAGVVCCRVSPMQKAQVGRQRGAGRAARAPGRGGRGSRRPLLLLTWTARRPPPPRRAQVARLLKASAGAVTLAIGDGANDVSMIQVGGGRVGGGGGGGEDWAMKTGRLFEGLP
jgi:magnesium-transporting ATPase (P-type)